ncbi:hypothetical protein FACS1894142_3430 [Spirochaetia bacterium]|nr:hypothetical protein FACS1894142_3430 [Spirochaetia bacterium]
MNDISWEIDKETVNDNFNKDYTFDTYVVGKYNKFAYNAAISVAKNPGSAYNPVVLSGGLGLGKTHLLKAIGNYIYKESKRKIIYTTAEDFVTEFILSLQRSEMRVFKNKYRNADVLLLDDIQFLHTKPGTKEELFHTLNALYDTNKQVVFACDRPLSELNGFTDQLKSRISRGLVIELKAPDYETRYKILETMAASMKITIPKEVIVLIDNNITTNISDLKSSIIRLAAYAEFMGGPITIEIVQDQLKDLFDKADSGTQNGK